MNKDTITTFTKRQVNVLKPDEKDIYIEDIAHALSMMTRAGGHFSEFFSVGQHCIQCCEESMARNYTARQSLICLLHDASEAYIADVTRPVKKHMTMYIQIEDQLMQTVYEKFLGEQPTEAELALMGNIDDACLYYEFVHFMDEKLFEEVPVMISSPSYEGADMKAVESRYLELFQKLMKEMDRQ